MIYFSRIALICFACFAYSTNALCAWEDCCDLSALLGNNKQLVEYSLTLIDATSSGKKLHGALHDLGSKTQKKIFISGYTTCLFSSPDDYKPYASDSGKMCIYVLRL